MRRDRPSGYLVALLRRRQAEQQFRESMARVQVQHADVVKALFARLDPFSGEYEQDPLANVERRH